MIMSSEQVWIWKEVIPHVSKIMLHIIQERLKSYLYPQISPEQAGFMPNWGTREQIMNIRQMIEKFYEYNVPAYLYFLDYTKAFDTVEWEHLNILFASSITYI